MEYPKFKVCCRCFTFNQAKYITDAMNGFTMQQTSFPFVCTIVDDASTDGEQDVIRKYVEDNFDFSEGSVAFHKETDYAHITYAQHKTNKNCYFAVLYLKENHYSQRKPKMGYLSEWRDMCEYEAICEGDDWWKDETKLNKQVNVLEPHPSYSMCFHNAIIHYEENGSDALFANLEERVYYPKECISKWLVPTASIVYRMKYSNYIKDLKIDNERIIYGDNLLVLSMLHYGEVFAIAEPMSVYRKHSGGAVYSITEAQHDKFYKQLLHCKAIFKEYSQLLNVPLSDTCFNQALKALKRFNLLKFLTCIFLSMYYSPRRCFHSIFSLIC